MAHNDLVNNVITRNRDLKNLLLVFLINVFEFSNDIR